jgi:hypothetical protein
MLPPPLLPTRRLGPPLLLLCRRLGLSSLFRPRWFCGFCPCVALPLRSDIFMMPPLMRVGGSWLRLRCFLPPGPSGLSRPLSGFGGLSSVPGCGFVGRACRLLAGSYSFFGVGAAGWSLHSFTHQLRDGIYGSVPPFSPFGDPSTCFQRPLCGVGPRFHSRHRPSYGGCQGLS